MTQALGNSRIPRDCFGRFARSDENSKIPYGDPRVKLGDGIVGNSRIPKIKF